MSEFTAAAGRPADDAMRFKTEYESGNGAMDHNGKIMRDVSIPEENPMCYISPIALCGKIMAGESFVVFCGFARCTWCRSTVGAFIDAAKKEGIQKVYYLDIENIRDGMDIADGKAVRIKEPGECYGELLRLFDPVLREYELEDENGVKYDAGEKRIYAPNYIFVRDGQTAAMVENSPLQEDGYGVLTVEILDDMESLYREFLRESEKSL